MVNQLLNFFITAAHAEQPVTQSPQAGGMSFVLMFIVFIALIYFTAWRPQSKRAKEQQNLLNSLAVGDEVLTAGGVLGRIKKINDRFITLEIGDGINVVMQKNSIVNVLPKGTLKSIE